MGYSNRIGIERAPGPYFCLITFDSYKIILQESNDCQILNQRSISVGAMNMVIGMGLLQVPVVCFCVIFQTNAYNLKMKPFFWLTKVLRKTPADSLEVNQLWFLQVWCGANHDTNWLCDSHRKWDPGAYTHVSCSAKALNCTYGVYFCVNLPCWLPACLATINPNLSIPMNFFPFWNDEIFNFCHQPH